MRKWLVWDECKRCCLRSRKQRNWNSLGWDCSFMGVVGATWDSSRWRMEWGVGSFHVRKWINLFRIKNCKKRYGPLILGWTLNMHFWLPFGRDRLFLSILTASVSSLGFSLLSVGDNSHTRISSENKQNKHLICVCVWNNLTLHTSFKSYMLSLPQSVHLRDLTKGRPLSLTYLLPFSFPSDLTTPTRFQYSIVSSTLILPSYQFHHPGPVHHIPEQPLRSEQAPPVMRQI